MARPTKPNVATGPRISVSLSARDHEGMQALAAQHGVSISWLARKAVSDFLTRNKGELQLPLDLKFGSLGAKDDD